MCESQSLRLALLDHLLDRFEQVGKLCDLFGEVGNLVVDIFYVVDQFKQSDRDLSTLLVSIRDFYPYPKFQETFGR